MSLASASKKLELVVPLYPCCLMTAIAAGLCRGQGEAPAVAEEVQDPLARAERREQHKCVRDDVCPDGILRLQPERNARGRAAEAAANGTAPPRSRHAVPTSCRCGAA